MKLLETVSLALVCLAMASCTSAGSERSKVALMIPNGFRGEIYILEDNTSGQDWRKADIVVSASGITTVKDLPALAEIAPGKFRAKYANGEKLGNSVLRTGNEVSLWPVTYLTNELLYFVVGTWDEKTDRENEKMHGDWKEVVARIRAEQ